MDTKTQAIINTLTQQRNQAQDAIAALSGVIAEMEEKLKKYEVENAQKEASE